jgi:hypothetical protein
MNNHLLNTRAGDTESEVTLDMTGQSFGNGGSLVPDGLYAMDIKDAHWEPKKKGKAGINLKATFEIAEPAEFRGARVVSYIPAPAGVDTDEAVKSGHNQMANLIASIASGRGNLEGIRKEAKLSVSPASLKNKRAFAYLRQGEPYGERGTIKSEIAFWVESERFASAPGPDRAAQPPAPRAEKGNGTGTTPNLMEEATAQAGQSAAKSLLF